MSGSAKLGSDYTLSGNPGEVVIEAGQTSGFVTLHATTGATSGKKKKNKMATMLLQSGTGYKVSKPKKAMVTIIP
jgi:hypothetical protein